MNIAPVSTIEDRSIAVPPGYVVQTGYVEIYRIRLACRERMAIGDVDRAYQRQLQLGEHQAWPCPRGHWDGDIYVLVDGRHSYVATLMLGFEHLLVAWVVKDGTLVQ